MLVRVVSEEYDYKHELQWMRYEYHERGGNRAHCLIFNFFHGPPIADFSVV